MRITKKIARQGEVFKGSIKKAAGNLSGNRHLSAEGHRDQTKANIKQAGAKVKDAFRK
ncbi:MAG: CsbD family protein [Streptosporangiaceae bacterium]